MKPLFNALSAFTALTLFAFLIPFTLFATGCAFETTSGEDASPLKQDSIVLDLFTLSHAIRSQSPDYAITAKGEALLQPFDSSLWIGDPRGENLLFPARQNIRTFIAYQVHESDIHCREKADSDRSLVLISDDSIPSGCADTAYAYIPAYPYWKQVEITYIQGQGFWLKPGLVSLARGKFKILFEYWP